MMLFVLAADAKIIRLDNHNFESKTQASRGEYSGYWVVSFCDQSPRCQKLQGIMNDLSNELKRTSKGLVFATVDAENPANNDLLDRFAIHDTPTLIFIEQAHYAKYSSRKYSKSKVKNFAQTHAHNEQFKRVPKPKDIIEETIGPVLEAMAGFVFFWPVAILMNLGLAEMPARILWFGVLYVSGKTFEETVWKQHCSKKKKKEKVEDYNDSEKKTKKGKDGDAEGDKSTTIKKRNKKHKK